VPCHSSAASELHRACARPPQNHRASATRMINFADSYLCDVMSRNDPFWIKFVRAPSNAAAMCTAHWNPNTRAPAHAK